MTQELVLHGYIPVFGTCGAVWDMTCGFAVGRGAAHPQDKRNA